MKGKRTVNLEGKVFGNWTVIKRAIIPNKYSYWKCQCICGNIKDIVGPNLTGGLTTSCGCVHHEHLRQLFQKHEMSRTDIYVTWENMIDRCYNPKNPRYKTYGKRGIKVCDRWLNSFDLFYKDMGDSPEGLSLDRIDNDDDYYKKNCRWATPKQQSNNRTNNNFITYKGETKTITQWAETFEIHPMTLLYRIRQNWDLDRVFNTPGRTKFINQYA